ncbi:MAG: hypothetical protein M1819_001898 [Sarea resinae]|nr:MAG: hypothetical protein M1819_001898 [Sarea resinae]
MYKWSAVQSAIGRGSASSSRPLQADFARVADGIAASLRSFHVSASRAAAADTNDAGPKSQPKSTFRISRVSSGENRPAPQGIDARSLAATPRFPRSPSSGPSSAPRGRGGFSFRGAGRGGARGGARGRGGRGGRGGARGRGAARRGNRRAASDADGDGAKYILTDAETAYLAQKAENERPKPVPIDPAVPTPELLSSYASPIATFSPASSSSSSATTTPASSSDSSQSLQPTASENTTSTTVASLSAASMIETPLRLLSRRRPEEFIRVEELAARLAHDKWTLFSSASEQATTIKLAQELLDARASKIEDATGEVVERETVSLETLTEAQRKDILDRLIAGVYAELPAVAAAEEAPPKPKQQPHAAAAATAGVLAGVQRAVRGNESYLPHDGSRLLEKVRSLLPAERIMKSGAGAGAGASAGAGAKAKGKQAGARK